MMPTFDYAIRYWITAECVSPLRIGGSEHNMEEVDRYQNGQPFIPGTSLAGALRGWKDNDDLFGSQAQEGQLRISDARFLKSPEITLRPRLCMDGATGTVENKFDIAQLPAGFQFSFEIVWKGIRNCKAPESVLSDNPGDEIEQYLSALNQGEIRLGAQKSNGYGAVRLSSVKRRCYNLYRESDRLAWLDEPLSGAELVTLQECTPLHVRFHVTAKTSSLLVKASAGIGVGEEGIDAVQMKENGKWIIPGASIKGAIRSHIEKISDFFDVPQSYLENSFGRAAKEDSGIAGTVYFSDCAINAPSELPKQTRIHINRITGGVIRGGLFSEQPVSGSCEWDIAAPNEERLCGLLLFALRDLGLGLYALGSGNSIGRGRFQKLCVSITSPDGNASLTVENDQVKIDGNAQIIQKWINALKEKQHEN